MISAEQVKELRELTGAGMMECKKVLAEVDGDKDKAIELLRERGVVKAAKKAGITKITHVDIHQKTIFIFWGRVTVNVYGE